MSRALVELILLAVLTASPIARMPSPLTERESRLLEQAHALKAQNLAYDSTGNGFPSSNSPQRGESPDPLIPSATSTVVDWPFSPGPIPTLSQRVRAIFLADDDGQRRVSATAQEVALWVARANEIHAAAHIQFTFDPAQTSGDWQAMNSTLLNNMTGTGDPTWAQEKALANQIAAQTPERMVVFFRWGPGASPTGGGFSWTDYNFIVMPGFGVTTVCGHQNISLFAHEQGHYLGLPHTFGPTFASVSDAQAYFISHGDDPEVFNADGRDETEPDPFTSAVQCDTATTALILDGIRLPLPRSNIMSYYEPHGGVVNSQIWTMRQALLVRSCRNLANIVSGELFGPDEAEGHLWSASGGSWGPQAMTPFLGFWSGGEQLLWLDGGVGDSLTTSFWAPEAGEYDIYGSFTAAGDFGIHTHTINGQQAPPIDLYADIVLVTGPVYLGRFNLAAGANSWTARATGSNPRASAARHGYGLDYILLSRPATTSVRGGHGLGAVTRLLPGQPNPFSTSTTFQFEIPTGQMAELRIYDVAGRLVKTLLKGEQVGGIQSISWPGTDEDGNAIRSGVYFCSLTAGLKAETRRIAVIR